MLTSQKNEEDSTDQAVKGSTDQEKTIDAADALNAEQSSSKDHQTMSGEGIPAVLVVDLTGDSDIEGQARRQIEPVIDEAPKENVPESIVEDNTEDVEIPSDLRDKSPEEPNNDNNIDYIQQVEDPHNLDNSEPTTDEEIDESRGPSPLTFEESERTLSLFRQQRDRAWEAQSAADEVRHDLVVPPQSPAHVVLPGSAWDDEEEVPNALPNNPPPVNDHVLPGSAWSDEDDFLVCVVDNNSSNQPAVQNDQRPPSSTDSAQRRINDEEDDQPVVLERVAKRPPGFQQNNGHQSQNDGYRGNRYRRQDNSYHQRSSQDARYGYSRPYHREPPNNQSNGRSSRQSDDQRAAPSRVYDRRPQHHNSFNTVDVHHNDQPAGRQAGKTVVQRKDSCNWIEVSLVGNRRNPPSGVLKKFEPRAPPRFYNITVDNRSHMMVQTEYLVCFCNDKVAIGMVKSNDRLEGQPLVIQFGYWNSDRNAELIVGSTVVVRKYCFILDSKGRPRTSSGADCIIRNDYLYPTALATSYAILKTPVIERVLGTIKKFASDSSDAGVQYVGSVHDQEYDTHAEVLDDQWSLNMRREPNLKDAVILTWVCTDEPHIVFTNRQGAKHFLPEHAGQYTKEKMTGPETYWLLSATNMYSNKEQN